MKITVFTSNQPRHLALIEGLGGIADEVHAIQECTTVLPGRVDDFFRKSPVMQTYFQRVMDAEAEQFGRPRFSDSRRNVRSLAIRMGDLNLLDLDTLAAALKADVFVVFGAGFIRGPLCDALVQRRAVNIHMGVSPYYRGSSTNFWALYDRRPELVGATIHQLTAGLDSGPILFHAFPAAGAMDPFRLGMNAVAAAHSGLLQSISKGRLHDVVPVPQDRRLELRYTRGEDFTDAVASEYLSNLPTAVEIERRLRQRDPAQFVRPHVT